MASTNADLPLAADLLKAVEDLRAVADRLVDTVDKIEEREDEDGENERHPKG